MPERGEQIIFSRHTERADGAMGYGLESDKKPSEKYPSVTNEGERKAREIARSDFKDLIEHSAEDSILFIGGASEEQRTKATAEIIGDELANEYQESEQVVVFTKDKIDELHGRAKKEKISILKIVKSFIENNPDKKIVFTFPFYLKEFSLRPHHRKKETGEHTDYILEILKKTGRDENAAALEWFKNNGRIETADGRVLEVPSPQQTAETQMAGINRLKEFAEKFSQGRQVNIGVVGHGWQLDALAVYLANKGKVNEEAFKNFFGNQIIKQPETGTVSINGDAAKFNYRDKEFEMPKNLVK